jgi:UDPglucose 6-dehydrogenase
MNESKVIVTKSTAPVGTSTRIRQAIEAGTNVPFWMCSNPEFLSQGSAVSDFMKPDRVVVGHDSDEARETMAELYAPYVRTGNPILFMDIASAELTKYAANAMLASRISFMNKLAELCDRVGADVLEVRRGMAADHRIGSAFLFPGPGYGGSCLPKDLKALAETARSNDVNPDLFDVIGAVNERQRTLLLTRALAALGPDPAGRAVGVWGLAFKAGTDDLRESPAIPLIEGLLAANVVVRAHDPKAADNALSIFGDRITLVSDPYDAVRGGDALIIMTEWLPYRTPDFERIHRLLRTPNILDGRNLYEPKRMRQYGFIYQGIGRGKA